MTRVASRPLDPDATQAADDGLYAAHEDDPRPNALYDADGNRTPLDSSDPAQASLRQEWMDLYVANGGQVEGGSTGATNEREPDSATAPCPLAKRQGPAPTIRAQWVRQGAHTDYVVPDHNPANGVAGSGGVAGVNPVSSTDEYPFEFQKADAAGGPITCIKFIPPDECIVSPLAEVANVPDGTAAKIQIIHCQTNRAVADGGLDDLVVQGGRVVRTETGEPPKLSFRADQSSWTIWDKPFFYFRVQVDYQDLQAETSKRFQDDAANCLRIKYWHACIGDNRGAIAGSVRTKCTTTQGFLNGVAQSMSMLQYFTAGTESRAAFGSCFRNTYAAFSDSHGTLVKRSDNWTLCPAHDYSKPPNLNRSEWKSVVCFSPQPFTSATEVADGSLFVSVPSFLYYISACLAGFEASLANAFIDRGCRHVIAYGKVIYTDKGEEMARRFFRAWANTYQLNPDKIPDAFTQAKCGLETDLCPVLFPTDGLSAGSTALIVLGALAVVAAGVIVGAAAFGLL